MSVITPSSPEELAAALQAAAARNQTIRLGGNFSKSRMGGHVHQADAAISTSGLRRILQYEPKDLTVSVEAGLPWCELVATLAAERQMIPLDPPFPENATAGGVIAANCSGPRRRLYGRARDLVIGTKFATLAGKVVQSGGMVVKNVAGLDMSKLLIGSFGTLAALTAVNFKLNPMPAGERTFLLEFDEWESAFAARDRILRSVLQPAAIDLLNPAAAAQVHPGGCLLAVNAAGSPAVIDRYGRELSGFGSMTALDGTAHSAFWRGVQNFVPEFVARRADAAVVRVSSTLRQMREILESLTVPAVARAGSGVCHAAFESASDAAAWMAEAGPRGWKAVMEFGPENRAKLDLWPGPGSDLAVFERIKEKFDPHRLLNRGRLYNRI